METRVIECLDFPEVDECGLADEIKKRVAENVVYVSREELDDAPCSCDGEPARFKVTITVEKEI